MDLRKYEMDYSKKFDDIEESSSSEEDEDPDAIEGVSQIEVIPGAPKVNQISIDPNENQTVQMANIMKKINDADAAKKQREYEIEQSLEDEVIWSYEITGAGTTRANGFYTQQNNGKYHNGAPRYRNSNNVYLSRELQAVAGSEDDKRY